VIALFWSAVLPNWKIRHILYTDEVMSLGDAAQNIC
jgi:hypothetical protein